MKLRHILTAAAATFALATSSAAFARDYHNDGDQRHHHSDRNDHRDGDRNASRNHNWSGNSNRNYMGGGSYRNRDYNRSSYNSNRNNNGSYYHDRDNDRGYGRGYDDNRGYRSGYYGHRSYVDRDRVFYVMREHNYSYVGDPYWYGDAYVVRAYDPFGRLVLVRVDPYTGAWLGVMFRL